jgi:hypothetical protein
MTNKLLLHLRFSAADRRKKAAREHVVYHMPHSLGQHVMPGNCFRATAPQHRWGPSLRMPGLRGRRFHPFPRIAQELGGRYLVRTPVLSAWRRMSSFRRERFLLAVGDISLVCNRTGIDAADGFGARPSEAIAIDALSTGTGARCSVSATISPNVGAWRIAKARAKFSCEIESRRRRRSR